MTNIYDVANFFINYDKNDEERHMTNMKLNKLLYFAQGHFLERYGKPLFNDKIEAWQHGPVVRDIYLKYKDYENIPVNDETIDTLAPDELKLLKDVAEEYGQFEASKLRNMTHEQGKAWSKVYVEWNKVEIPLTLIEEDFKGKEIYAYNETTIKACKEVDTYYETVGTGMKVKDALSFLRENRNIAQNA
jgi:uncharacterized phage-associated protein